MGWAGLPWDEVVVVGAFDAKKSRLYLEQYLISIGCRCWGVGDRSWCGDIAGGGVSQSERTSIWTHLLEMEDGK